MSGRYDDDFEEYEVDSNSSQEEVKEECCEDYDKSSSSSSIAEEIEVGFEDISALRESLESDSVIRKSMVSGVLF